MQGLGLFLIFVISLVSLCAVDAHTAADDLRQLTKGGSNVVLGAIKGEVELIRRGVAEGGEYNSVLDARLGTMIFRLGRVWEDFPKWPSLHLSIAGGKRPHLNAAFFLMGTGAVSVNDYQLPLTITDGLLPNALDVGYGPAFVYALGMGGIKPTASHGALLQRLYESLPDQFNMSHVNVWLNQTANPPLIHFPVYAGFEEGLHVLKDDFKLSLNEQDYFGSTPLHVATWLGDLELLAYLLNSGADRLIKDKNGKLALHYAVSRGYSGAVEMLLIAPQKYSPKKALDMRRKMFSQKDKDGRTPIDQAKLPPAHPKVLASLERFSFELDGQQSRLNQRYPLKDDSRTAQFVLELEDALGTRGGKSQSKIEGSISLFLENLIQCGVLY
jgi:ankyrin repeat protein